MSITTDRPITVSIWCSLASCFLLVEPLLYGFWTQPKCHSASLKQRGIILRSIFDLVLRLGLGLTHNLLISTILILFIPFNHLLCNKANNNYHFYMITCRFQLFIVSLKPLYHNSFEVLVTPWRIWYQNLTSYLKESVKTSWNFATLWQGFDVAL